MANFDIWESLDGCLVAIPSEDTSFDTNFLPEGKEAQDFYPVALRVSAESNEDAVTYFKSEILPGLDRVTEMRKSGMSHDQVFEHLKSSKWETTKE